MNDHLYPIAPVATTVYLTVSDAVFPILVHTLVKPVNEVGVVGAVVVILNVFTEVPTPHVDFDFTFIVPEAK